MAAPTRTPGDVKLLLDEMHAPTIAEALCTDGHDVVAVAAEPDLRGTSDSDLLSHTFAEARALVTEDVGDFSVIASQWAAEGRAHCGVVFTSPKRFDRASVAYPGNLIAALGQFLAGEPDEGDSWTWWL